MRAPIALPEDWVGRVSGYPPDGGPSGADWVRTVPRLLDAALDRWDLAVDGEPRTGWTAIVAPVRRGAEQLALKVTWPHDDGTHEHLALRLWKGNGAVRLIAALPGDGTMLLERLDPDTDLTTLDPEAGCRVVGGLLPRLGIPAPDSIPDLATWVPPHLDRMTSRAAVPRRIADRTNGLARELLSDGDSPKWLLHTDLHYENVLRGHADEWVAIDPKPLRGHPGFEILPLLWNRPDDLGDRPFRTAMRRRLEITAESAGIDVDDAYAWSLLRAGLEVSWTIGLDGQEADLTTFVALTKALDD